MKRKIVSPEQREAIRKAYGDGTLVSLTDVAYQFGLSVSTVSNIVNNDVRARALAKARQGGKR